MKSKTPRTDEHLRMKEKNGHVVIVSRDFARQLETELADKNKQLAEARAEIDRLERREYQLKKDNIESLDLLAADTALQNRLADQIESKDKQIIEERAEIERLKHIERCLREEFLLNTQNYPKEYHALFQRKFKAALSVAERGGK